MHLIINNTGKFLQYKLLLLRVLSFGRPVKVDNLLMFAVNELSEAVAS